jgi:AraC-like DNA-binding protein
MVQPTMARPRVSGYAMRGAAGLCPCLMGVFECVCSQHGLATYRHSQWILDYSITPFGRFRVKRNAGPWMTRLAHEAHLYAPDTRYWEDTSPCAGTTARSTYVVFSGGEECGLRRLVSQFHYARFSDPEGELGRLLSRMFTLTRELAEASFWPAQALLCEVLGLLNRSASVGPRHYVIQASRTKPAPSEIVNKVCSYCHAHLSERVRRRDMARHLGISVSTLSHRYRQEMGESPMATLTGMRINLAKGLLLKGNKLTTIAEQTGFCDAFQLSKTFKKNEGLSPRAFLASLRTGSRESSRT